MSFQETLFDTYELKEKCMIILWLQSMVIWFRRRKSMAEGHSRANLTPPWWSGSGEKKKDPRRVTSSSRPHPRDPSPTRAQLPTASQLWCPYVSVTLHRQENFGRHFKFNCNFQHLKTLYHCFPRTFQINYVLKLKKKTLHSLSLFVFHLGITYTSN